jgi:hypothetical protein
MKLREAIRRVRVRMENPFGQWFGDRWATDAVEALIAATQRPTRLEREAARFARFTEAVAEPSGELCTAAHCWLNRYERKRKVTR